MTETPKAGQTWRAEDGYLYRILAVKGEWVYARHPNARRPGSTEQIRLAWFAQPGWERVS